MGLKQKVVTIGEHQIIIDQFDAIDTGNKRANLMEAVIPKLGHEIYEKSEEEMLIAMVAVLLLRTESSVFLDLFSNCKHDDGPLSKKAVYNKVFAGKPNAPAELAGVIMKFNDFFSEGTMKGGMVKEQEMPELTTQ